jgi:hypothetical protein
MPDEQFAASFTASSAEFNFGRRVLTREELYALAWETPLSRLSKQFGLSDVGLRKICLKHNIPTPPLGWWAKRAHGKPVRRQPLPAPRSGETGEIRIALRAGSEAPPEIAAQQDAALEMELARPVIVVPSERPAKLHPVAAATSRALLTAKADSEGFKHATDDAAVDAMASTSCITRVICIIDAFARALAERGYTVANHHKGVRVILDGVSYEWRIYEIKGQIPHTPTRDELREQARLDEDRKRHPTLYASSRKVYRSSDATPSGRLAMVFLDASKRSWRIDDRVIGRWRDTKNQKLEAKLGEAMSSLVSTAVAIRHRLTAEAEKERLRQEELELRRRAQARREREILRREFVLKKADEYARYEKLMRLAGHLKDTASSWAEDQPVDWIISELESFVELLGRQFERGTLNNEIIGLKLYMDDDRPADETDEE